MAWQSRFDDFAYLDKSNKVPNNQRFKSQPGAGLGQNSFSFVNNYGQGQGSGIGGLAGQHGGGQARKGGDNGRWQNPYQQNDYNTKNTNQLNDSGVGNNMNICDLTNESHSASIIGLIIFKEGPKSFLSKKGTGTERHLIAFTIRDDETAFVNVTCWGGPEFAAKLSEFNIGDIVEIRGAQVQAKSKNPADEKFKPWTPSPFCLNLSENHGEFNAYHGQDLQYLTSLLHVPTRASNDFYTLEDIQANGMNLHTEHINILALVKKIWPVRELTTKTGKKTSKVDIVLCDETCPAFQLTLWDTFVTLSHQWTPLETVLFAADVRINHSDFHSAMVASTDSKTIFTVDPDITEAHALMEYGRTLVSDTGFEGLQTFDSNKDPDISSITNVLRVKDVKLLQRDLLCGTGENRYGVLYAFLNHFDVDTEDRSIVRRVCSKCHKSVENNAGFLCTSSDCAAKNLTADNNWPVMEYSISIGLTDESGSLESCYVAPSAMEQLLEYSASEFQHADQSNKTRLKWQYLFERVKAVLKISGNNGKTGKSFVRVLALEKPLHSEVMNKCFSSS